MDKKEINEEISNYWSEGSDKYDSCAGHGILHEEEETEWINFLNTIIPENTKNVLDVGAGTGFLTLLLAKMGYEVKSLDLSVGMQEKAKQKASDMGLSDKITFVISDAEDTNEESEKYDLVINRHLLWTLPNPQKAIKEWLRVVKKGGAVIIIDGDWANQNASFKKNEVKKEHARKYSDELHASLPLSNGEKSPKDYIKQIQEEGFKVFIYDLKNIEDLERKLFKEEEFMQNEEYRRDAYVIIK